MTLQPSPESNADRSSLEQGPPTASDLFTAWVAGLPPADLAATPAYARYDELLEAALVDLLNADEQVEFDSFLEEWNEEYVDLRTTIEAGYDHAWLAENARRTVPAIDLSFLQSPQDGSKLNTAVQRALQIWAAGLAIRRNFVSMGSFTNLQFSLQAVVPQADISEQIVMSELAASLDLIDRSIGPALDLGIPESYQVLVRAERVDETHCNLIATISGTALQGLYEQAHILVQRQFQPNMRAHFNAQGTATLGPLLIEALNGLVLTISVPFL